MTTMLVRVKIAQGLWISFFLIKITTFYAIAHVLFCTRNFGNAHWIYSIVVCLFSIVVQVKFIHTQMFCLCLEFTLVCMLPFLRLLRWIMLFLDIRTTRLDRLRNVKFTLGQRHKTYNYIPLHPCKVTRAVNTTGFLTDTKCTCIRSLIHRVW